MSTFDYSRTPVNREAAIVTSQSGCATDGTLADEQKRENLVAKVKAMQGEILTLKRGSRERKELGAKKAEIEIQINKLRPKRSMPNLGDYVLDVLRDELSDFQFKRLMTKASDLYRKKQSEGAAK